MIRGAPIGKHFEHATLENFEVTQFNRIGYEACQKLVKGDTLGVVLRGPVGVGKTHLLVGLAKSFLNVRAPNAANDETVEVQPISKIMENTSPSSETEPERVLLSRLELMHDPEVEFWPMLDLASELRAEVMHGELYLSRRCRMCDLLILDDLGREKLTDFILQEFQRIVDWRYREEKPIAVATNRLPEEIIERYGENTYSRWKETCEIAEVTGPDLRLGRD